MTTIVSRKRKTKYPFTLKCIDVPSILTKYGFDLLDVATQSGSNVTKLTDLIIEKEPEYYFLDETRNIKKCSVSMKDYFTGNEVVNNISCYWCRHSFNTIPLGCPIEYVPNKIIKRYFSEITKDYYTIKENISRDAIEEFVKLSENNDDKESIKVIENDYYLTDGVFCSFNCCLSWIRDNSHNPLFATSSNLLHQIYFETFETIAKIQVAPHWRLLKDYGGKMSIDEFRNSYKNSIYKESSNIKSIVKTKTIGIVFEEYIKI